MLAWPLPPIMARDALLRRPLLRMIVYKIVATEEWAEAEAVGAFTGASVDRADGFIHFSTAEQAPETAAKWLDRKSTRLNSSHLKLSRMPSSA